MTLFRSKLFTRRAVPLRRDLRSGLLARSTSEVIAAIAVASALLALLLV